jgi:L-methionine (R)-S-oxide reductase
LSEVQILDRPTPDQLLAQLDALLDPSEPPLTLLANTASLLYWSLPGINWLGFYLADGRQLRLGPFHGKPACTVIAFDSGVCGTAAAQRRTLNVPDVELFPGHIACDADSRSELVVPLLLGGRLWGVMDVDSPEPARFDTETQILLERAASMLCSRLGDGTLFPA